ncbi:hypothetical protein EDC94DRAFT_596074 [Helicostylum pulchrum]|uniref:DUF218 domain-containing protein n=1 Tax=Helicostylum pulchrum TaxID=562976 RepID=A0ABP9XLH4_9FUNG|nr:hypothetical protein EDC94DRAFT_596074 [Helicostylum pulchrum]
MSNNKRKTILPLHIDTTSFTGPTQGNGYIWRRLNKRQVPIFILLTILFSSLLLNLIQHKYKPSAPLFNSLDSLPPLPLIEKHHAIIVAGHAIYTGPDQLQQTRLDSNWVLEPFQQGGQIHVFIEHIQKGIELLKRDTNAVLIFSGGETRPKAGPRSEAFSYWQIAKILLDNDNSLTEKEKETLPARMITEEFAKDSHENLLFSICRFSEMTGNYPRSITVIGFEFKRQRFQDIHRYAIGYPLDQFEYIGIDPSDAEAPDRERGELLNSFKPFQKDLYGCHSVLKQKKKDRNPFRRRHAYATSCPILAPLLNYCPSNNALYTGTLPWKS